MSGPIVFGEAAEALFRLSAPTAVSAGAGSGKTTALVELCVRLLSGEATGTPCEPSALVAITFTEKAAEELVLRLREAVAERARAAARAAPGSDVAQAWLDRLHGLDRMAAGTIHAFCGRLLREHAPEAGLDPEFTVVDEERASAWLRAAARAAVVAALDAGRPAARLLTAGLGAEARGGLAGLVAELVRARATRGDAGPVPVAPVDEAALRSAWERLGAAAGDVVTLARAARGAGAQKLLDAVARAWVALEGATHGTPGEDAPARLRALEEATHGPRLGKDDATLREARDALRAHADEVSRLEADRLAGPQKEELALLVADSEARYAARKREARAMDFDDLLVRARDLLAGDRALVAELRGRLGALLVDEYQDVNALQQQVFDLLAGPGEPRGPTLVAVGDLKQSIYRFRGADVSVFARLVRRFGAGEGRVLHLSANHRSAPAVLDLVNEVSARCMVPPAGAAPRDDEIRFGDADRLVPRRPEGARPACEVLVDDGGGAAAERRLREADAIVRRIQAMVSGAAGVVVRERGEGGVERTRRPRFGDVAVLFRRLTQIGPYERALRAAGLPFRLARGGGFYQAPEVRDLGELAATLFDPSDALAWAALLRSPLCAVSDGTLVLVARGGLGRLGWIAPEALRAQVEAIAAEARSGRAPAIPPDEWERLVRLLRVWQDLRAVRDRLALPDLLRRAVAALDLDAALLAAPEGERRAVNLEKAIALAARFEADGGRAPELARHLRALAARPPREPEAELEAEDAIAILSVHQAKGLEWPIVLVPDLGAAARADTRRALLDADGRLCAQLYDAAREEHVETAAMRSAREAERRAAAAESRRLLYVALTRARDRLVLSGEPGRGGESWRGLVEVAAEARPDLVLRVPASEAATRAAAPALPAAVPAAAPPQALLAAPGVRPLPAAPPPRPVPAHPRADRPPGRCPRRPGARDRARHPRSRDARGERPRCAAARAPRPAPGRRGAARLRSGERGHPADPRRGGAVRRLRGGPRPRSGGARGPPLARGPVPAPRRRRAARARRRAPASGAAVERRRPGRLSRRRHRRARRRPPRRGRGGRGLQVRGAAPRRGRALPAAAPRLHARRAARISRRPRPGAPPVPARRLSRGGRHGDRAGARRLRARGAGARDGCARRDRGRPRAGRPRARRGALPRRGLRLRLTLLPGPSRDGASGGLTAPVGSTSPGVSA